MELGFCEGGLCVAAEGFKDGVGGAVDSAGEGFFVAAEADAEVCRLGPFLGGGVVLVFGGGGGGGRAGCYPRGEAVREKGGIGVDICYQGVEFWGWVRENARFRDGEGGGEGIGGEGAMRLVIFPREMVNRRGSEVERLRFCCFSRWCN